MNEKQPVIGYTTGVYDLFHIGHLNLFKNAKGMCDRLIVGVTVDELVEYKGKKAMIPFEDRTRSSAPAGMSMPPCLSMTWIS